MSWSPTVNPFPERRIREDEVIRDVHFPDPLDVRVYAQEPFPGDGHFQQLTDFRMLYKLEGDENFRTFLAYRGMMHDFASIPDVASGLPSFRPHEGPHVPGSVIHDAGFLQAGLWRKPHPDDFYNVNRLFSAAMAHFGTKRWVRSVMFNAVNSDVGWQAYEDHGDFQAQMNKWLALLDG